mmetsp:Transcript_25186/g.67523  ORF Transcript_25186/g.67523 Transcript_25186/m.67523 type:complete len:260 (-) Transcript_25186:540-1319(-)
MSASDAPGDAAYLPLSCALIASPIEFLIGEKENQRSKSAKPTAAPGASSLGMSCIMHSSRVGFLNAVRLASSYFGLTNSGIAPPLPSRAALYGARARTKVLELAGKGEKPVASGASPALPEARSSASSWLYSTLITSGAAPSGRSSLQMAPAASPATRGTVTLAIERPLRSHTPSVAGIALNASAFVSWKNTTYRRPSAAKRGSKPDACSSVCTSPWPCGLVCSRKGSSPSRAKRPSLSASDGTFDCVMKSTCSRGIPK